jgi:mono/diheme cytochrome c family protein
MWKETEMMTRWLFFCLLIIPTAISASGSGQLHYDSGHMAAMEAGRASIPDEYRVMDRTPLTPDEESLLRGKELFRANCVVCHGDEGRGDGPAAASLATPPANFHDAHHSGFYNPGEKFWIISHGLDIGMPAFGDTLTPQQRWDLVNHLLQLPQESINELFR